MFHFQSGCNRIICIPGAGYRRTENRVRHYDKLPRYLEGLLVYGDAAYALNPVYAQGITAAVMGSRALAQCLSEQRNRQELTGLARAFQTELSRAVASTWKMSTSQDQRWPATEVAKQLNSVPSRGRHVSTVRSKKLAVSSALA